MANNTNNGREKDLMLLDLRNYCCTSLIAFNLIQLKPRSIDIQVDDFYELAENGYVEKIDVIKNEEKGKYTLTWIKLMRLRHWIQQNIKP